ncbi:hypothetical protein A6V25_26095 [Nostoc sp. ATCC 53789]|nr:hypothetical protein A6V25_26095 [Nostoc sp. ATCC 53789]
MNFEFWRLNSVLLNQIPLRELQEINYPILWGGHLARPVYMAGKMPTPQELIGYFLFGSPLSRNFRKLSL